MYFITPQQTNPAVPDKSVNTATFDFYFTFKTDKMHSMYFIPNTIHKEGLIMAL